MTAAAIAGLDAHEQPSGYLRSRWKAYSRATADEILQGDDVDDVDNEALRLAGTLPRGRVAEAFAAFLAGGEAAESGQGPTAGAAASADDVPVYAHPLLPGASEISLFPLVSPSFPIHSTLL